MITLLDGGIGRIKDYYDRLDGLVIELGGGQGTCPKATHVIDFNQPENGLWTRGNLCDPDTYSEFPDKMFDWVYCNHTLEDVYDPFIVLRQAMRIARRGLFGMPHWSRELTIQSDRPDWESISGWPHHQWLIGVNRLDGALEFFPKMNWVVRGEWETTTNNINFEWDGGELPFRWVLNEYPGASLRRELTAWLSDRWLP